MIYVVCKLVVFLMWEWDMKIICMVLIVGVNGGIGLVMIEVLCCYGWVIWVLVCLFKYDDL